MALTLDELIEHILLESGQFIGGLEFTLIDKEAVGRMAERELAVYSRYFPGQVTSSARLYNNKVFQLENDGFVPETILEIRRREVSDYIFGGSRRFGQVASYFWRYEKPVLYFNCADDLYEVTYSVRRVFDKTLGEISGLSIENKEFVDLCTAKFMIALGRSRRSVTTQEFPINADGAELVSEGTAMYDTAMDTMRKSSTYWLALLP